MLPQKYRNAVLKVRQITLNFVQHTIRHLVRFVKYEQ